MTVTPNNAPEVATILKDFLKPFEENEIKVKPQKVSGNRALVISYIDARLVLDRLDEVVGLNGWKDEYTVLPGGTEVECRLSVRIAGEWITKADVGGESEQPDGGDRMKAAYSDALKRAAVKFGIGRFLYRRPQQWMDYDPVRKQIIRPGDGAKPTQPKPAEKQLRAGELRERFLSQLHGCKSRDEAIGITGAVAKAKREGLLTDADCDALRPACDAVFAKYPAKETAKA